MTSSTIITEGARIAPVPVGWAAMLSATPSTQVTVAAGLLTCLYLIAQTIMILRRMRSDQRRLEMAEEEHARRMSGTDGVEE